MYLPQEEAKEDENGYCGYERAPRNPTEAALPNATDVSEETSNNKPAYCSLC